MTDSLMEEEELASIRTLCGMRCDLTALGRIEDILKSRVKDV